MKRFFTGCFSLVAIAASSVHAQNGYVVTEKFLTTNDMVVASNETGWYVVENYTGAQTRYTLNGPGGYSRDITDLAPKSSEDGAVMSPYVAAVDKDGAVYFAQNIGIPQSRDGSGSLIQTGDTVKKLARDSNITTEFRSSVFNPDTILHRHYQINAQGQLVELQGVRAGERNQLTLKRFAAGRELEQTLTFPEVPFRRSSRERSSFELGSSGQFVVYRESTTRNKKDRNSRITAPRTVVTGLCTGDVSSPELLCMKANELTTLNRRSFQVVGLARDTLVLVRRKSRSFESEYVGLDPKSFTLISSIATPTDIYGPQGISFSANGDIRALLPSSPFELSKIRLVEHTATDGKRTVLCRFKKKFDLGVAISPLGWIQPLGSGGFLIFGQEIRRPKVLELTPASVSTIPADSVGQCVPR
jgi:hypothetical protein